MRRQIGGGRHAARPGRKPSVTWLRYGAATENAKRADKTDARRARRKASETPTHRRAFLLLSGKARNPMRMGDDRGTRIRRRGRNSALCPVRHPEYRPATARRPQGRRHARSAREGSGAPRRNRPCARGWPARRPARRRFHARRAAQTTDREGAPSFAARPRPAQKAEHTAAAGSEHRRARSGMIDWGGKRFPRKAQKPRAFGVAEQDALGFQERQRAEQRQCGQPEQQKQKAAAQARAG